MIETLVHLDTQLFLLLNGLHNSFFDGLMWGLSSKTLWIPMYLYFSYLLFKQHKKQALIIALAVIVSVALADSLSVALFKNVFLRLRPSHNPALEGLVHIVNGYKGGDYGFVSSHAANTFAMAVLLAHFLKAKYRYFSYFIFSWAVLVSYSRIYLGVHFPGDVICGALFGSLIAYLVLKTYNYWLKEVFMQKLKE
ncbi:MAG: phosphatase PAP2 family protein [Bacteroidota bacterium]